MSDKDSKNEVQKEGADQKGGKMAFSTRFAIFMSMVMAAIFLPVTIVFSVCMIPTLVAAIVDNNYPRTAWLTIGAVNLAGTVPVWFNLWDMGHSVPAAFQLIIQPETIVIPYIAAAVGWAIYSYVTPFVAVIIVSKNERRLREIDKRQKDLIKKWGKGVIVG